MKIELTQKPAPNAVIIEGFPGFGFVSTIATQYIVKHLNAKPIGRIISDKISPLIAIHNNEIIEPLQILYDKGKNIILVQALIPVDGIEWDIAETIIELAKQIKAKEIIGLEGVASQELSENPKVFFFTNDGAKRKKFQEMNINDLNEGIIVGVTGALLMKIKEGLDFTCFFVESHSQLPDNNAASKLIEILDKYINLGIDFKPLKEQAKQFEGKLKELMAKLKDVKVEKEKKSLSYTG